MRRALPLLFWILAGTLFAQENPQLAWQGYISGSATLYVHGKTVDVQGRDTGSVDRPSYRFEAALPAAKIAVKLKVVRGEGSVAIQEQPGPENEYTAVVQIDPPGNRHEYFVLHLSWDSSSNSPTDRTERPDGVCETSLPLTQFMTWSGLVDEEVLIEIRRRSIQESVVRGQSAKRERLEFPAALPAKPVNIRLEKAEGRGKVELVQEPGADNDYTAIVRIVDQDNGAGKYFFRLAWAR